MKKNKFSIATNYHYIMNGLPFIILAIVLMFHPLLYANITTLNAIVSFGSSLLVVFIGFLFWELKLKRVFADELFETARISANIQESGLIKVERDFRKLDLSSLLGKSSKLEFAVVFGRTFFKSNQDIFTSFIEKGNKVICYIPNWQNIELLNAYAKRFNFDLCEVKMKIMEAEQILKENGVEVRSHELEITSSYYLFDNTAVLSEFNYNDSGIVPGFIVSDEGFLYDFVKGNIERIRYNSRSISSE